MESQCLGLAEALGLPPILKRIALRSPWRQLTPYVRIGGSLQFADTSDRLRPPWPDLLIATGRHSVAPALHVKAASARDGKRTIAVQLQNPVIAASHFDLVVVPRHDGLTGRNVVATRGALHRVTPELLKTGAERLAPRIASLPRPYVAVLLGGSNGAYRFDAETATRLGQQLTAAARAISGSLLITPSRRTAEDGIAAIRAAVDSIPHFIWNGEGENPYFGMLGSADFILATSDSVNMVSEAAATGKPLYVFDLPGGSAKFRRFHDGLRADGIARPFAGTLEPYAYPPLNDMAAVAARVTTLLHG
jgi:mitochondrial fission protein ELM1